MKKTIMLSVTILILCCCFNFCASAKDDTVAVQIPDYQIIIDNSLVYYADSLYPFLNYKGITYLPMTYEYSRAMNLTTGYLEGTSFMVAYHPCDDKKLPVYETANNKKYNTAVVPTGYNIYVNAKKIDNKKAEYPLLNFRGVTYFPLTWEYAVEEFGWKLSFSENTLKIDTWNNTVKRWTLIEKREDDAVLELYDSREVVLEDGSFETDYFEEYYSVNYKTGELTKLTDYVQPEFVKNETLTEEVTLDDGYAYYKGQKLDGIYIKEASNDYIKPDDVSEVNYSISAFVSDKYAPLEVLEVNVYTTNYGQNSSWGTRMNYTFIIANGNTIPLGVFKTVENVYTLGNDIYFNTVEYGQAIFRHYRKNRKMWKLSENGELKEITYGDYNSIKIIGKANGKLYLKCLWSPENPSEDWNVYSVSLVNDGYYTFDGEGIKLVSPYIYSDYDIVSDDGDIICVNNKSDKIVRCEINPEYY